MIYNLIIALYTSAVRLAALFNKKVALMVKGEKESFDILQKQIIRGEKYLWFHAASLGEFEQGRPLIEEIRKTYPQYKILQTFFSPSGYEVRKNYKGADIVCYLPLDTPGNVKRFLDLAQPYMAFFIKYEFWQNYLNELQRRNIPVYSVSSIFRKEQIFFRWYGKSYRKVLNTFTHLFVQDEASVQLLRTIGITNTTVVGDTRFDRVLEICHQAKELPLVEKFKGNHTAFVAGSSWGPDEDIFIPYLNAHPEVKLIIAPHVIDESHLKEIISKLNRTVVRYTQATEEKVKEADCLLIDCFGLLSSIYRYGEIAYIGGGFGVGIHNVLEAAVYGMPVIFGPNNKRFREAQGLLQCKGGFEIQGVEDFKKIMDNFLNNYEALDSFKSMMSYNMYFIQRYIKIAFPVIVNETLWGFGVTLQNAIFAKISTDAIAAFNITGTISQLTWVFFIGIGNAAAIIIGKQIGAEDTQKALKYANKFALLMPILAIFIGALLFPLSKVLPVFFDVAPHIMAEATAMLMVLMVVYPLRSFNMCYIVGICRAGGDTVFAAVCDVAAMWCIALPMGFLAGFILHLQPWLVFMFVVSEDIFKAALGVYRIKSKKWLHNVTR